MADDARIGQHEAEREFYEEHGIDEWQAARLYHIEETDEWEARHDGLSVT